MVLVVWEQVRPGGWFGCVIVVPEKMVKGLEGE